MDTGGGPPYWVKTVEERHSHQCLVKVNQKIEVGRRGRGRISIVSYIK